MKQGENYTPKYTNAELEEFRAELEQKVKEPVYLEIEKYRYQYDFYQTHRHIYNTICCKKINTEIKYSTELYKKYNKEKIEEIRRKWGSIKEEFDQEVEKKIRDDVMFCIKESKYHLVYDRVYFEPEKFDEEVGYRCGLMPFIYKNYDTREELKLLAVVGEEAECEARLDAYQAITSGGVRKYNVLEGYEFTEKYLNKILRKEIVEEMGKKLVKSNKVKFYFENSNI